MRGVARRARPAQLDALRGRKPKQTTELERARQHFVIDGNKDGFVFAAYSADEVKLVLKGMFQGKCAYCEGLYDATQPVDLEHFRPKGEIETPTGPVKPGYWWLASDWDNLLPSCISCNREEYQEIYDGTTLKTGKGNRFPLEDEGMRATKEYEEKHERPMLIDPCREDPAGLLRFEDIGGWCLAVPVSPDPSSLDYRRATTSITIYGLNRASVVRDRTRYMVRIATCLRRLTRGIAKLQRATTEAEREEIDAEIVDELAELRVHWSGVDRFTGMTAALIAPVIKRLGIPL